MRIHSKETRRKISKSLFKGEIIKCLVCKKDKKSAPSQKRKYCSPECYAISRIGKKRPKHSAFMKQAHKKGIVSSDGFKGKTHTNEEKKRISQRLCKQWKDKNHVFNSNEYRQKSSDHCLKLNKAGKMNTGYSRSRSGYYDINGKSIFFRSMWEANYALYLDFLIKQRDIKKWEFEVDTFWFEAIRRGVRSYKPDFKILNNDESIEYHEIKGWMDPKSRTKIKRMAKYYPEVKLIVIEGDSYKDIKRKLGRMLKFYE